MCSLWPCRQVGVLRPKFLWFILTRKSGMSECCLDATWMASAGQARGSVIAVPSPKVTTADARGKHVKKLGREYMVLSLDISLSI